MADASPERPTQPLAGEGPVPSELVRPRRVRAPSVAASLAIHISVLAVVGVVWIPSARRTLEHITHVRLLPMAGDEQARAPAAPQSAVPRSQRLPRAVARADAPQPSAPRTVAPAARPAEPEQRTPEPIASTSIVDAVGPKTVGSPPAPSFSASSPVADQGGAGVDPGGVATALGGLGRSDALGAGPGGAFGAPGYRVNPKPDYPRQAREKGHEGTVVLRVRVLPDGTAGEVSVERSSGHEVLDGAALRAVKAWLFVPATRNGIPTPAWISVPIRFSLAS